MENNFDVVVVGAGAAGIHIAGLLAEKARVCIIESKADPTNVSFHTLGSFIQRERYGLSEKIIAANISELAYHSKHFHAIKHDSAFILNKAQIHRELLEKLVSGNVEMRWKTSARDVVQNPDGDIDAVVDTAGNIYRAKIFVDATGVAGFFSRKFGLQDRKLNIATGLEYNVLYHGPENQIHLYLGKEFYNGYGWIFPLGGKRAIIGYGIIGPHAVNMKLALDSICNIESVRALITKDNEIAYGGTVPITDVKTKFVFRNVLCVGDSVSQVHPLVGEGYRFVLESGKIAAPYIVQALEDNDILHLLGYEEEWRRIFQKSYQKGKRNQRIAEIASRSNLLSDALLLVIKMTSNEHAERAMSGGVKFI